MRSPSTLILLGIFSAGCHAPFKAALPGIDSVVTEATAREKPFVSLGYGNSPFMRWDLGVPYSAVTPVTDPLGVMPLVDLVIEIVEGAHETRLRPLIGDAVAVDDLAPALHASLVEHLDEGAPFTHGDGDRAGRLELEIMRYGMYVPYVGGPGEFQVAVRTKVFDTEGARVYRGRAVCGVHDAALVKNSAKVLKTLEPDRVHAGVVAAARACGETVVAKLLRHGS